MGQNQSQRKSRKDVRVTTSGSRSVTSNSDGSSVDPASDKVSDVCRLLSEAPKQADTLASLPTVPCASGGKQSLTDDPGNNNNSIPSVYDKANTKESVEVNGSEAKDVDYDKTLPEDTGPFMSVEKLSESLPHAHSNNELPLMNKAIDREKEKSRTYPGLKTDSKSAKSVYCTQKKKKRTQGLELEATNVGKIEKLDPKYIPNIRPNITLGATRIKTRSKRIPVANTMAESGVEPTCTRKEKVDNKAVEEKVKVASVVYDSETTRYIEELCELNNTTTKITEDNRVKYIVEDESDDDESHVLPKYIYSNVIFFPDRSKGATPKRYGPKRLGTLHPTETENAQSSTDSNESLTSVNDFDTMKSNTPGKHGDNKDVQEDTLPENSDKISMDDAANKYFKEEVFIRALPKEAENKKEGEERNTDNKVEDPDVKASSKEILDLDTAEYVKEEKVTYCASSNEFKYNKDPAMAERNLESNRDLEVLDNVDDDIIQSLIFEDRLTSNEQSRLSMNATEVGTDVCSWKEDIPDLSANIIEDDSEKCIVRPVNDKDAMPEIPDTQNVASGNKAFQKMNISSIRKPDTGISKGEDKVRNKKVNICQTTVHVSYRVPVRTVVDDLQGNVAPDLDWSKLRSRQARYASQLKSSRTNPGEDNRMSLEFSFSVAAGSSGSNTRRPRQGSRETQNSGGFNRSLSSGSESDFNSVVNDFDTDDDDSDDDVKTEERGFVSEDTGSCSKIEGNGNDTIVSDHYSGELVEKYGSVIGCLKRRMTNIEDDNRIVIAGDEAVCVEFDDEDEDGSDKSDSSDISSIQRSVWDDHSSNIVADSNDSEVDRGSSPEEIPSEGPFASLGDHFLRLLGDDSSSLAANWQSYLERLLQPREREEESSQRDEVVSREHRLKGIERFSRINRSRENREEIQRMLRKEALGKRANKAPNSPRASVEDGPEIQLAEDTDSNDGSDADSAAIECLDLEESPESVEGLVFAEEDIWEHVISSELKKAICDSSLPSDSRCTLLCLDTSASMKGKPWQDLERALKDFVAALEEIRQNNDVQEHVGVIIFGHETRIALPLTQNYQQILELFGHLSPGGCSPLAVGLALCMYPYVMKAMGKCSLWLNGMPVGPRIIIFTDGHPTPIDLIQGSDRLPKELHKKAIETVMESVEDPDFKYHIDCVALSDQANMGFLESLSAATGGKAVSASGVAELAFNTYSHYIAAHVGGPMLEAGENKVDVKVFEKLVWTIYPSITTKQLSDITSIIKKEVERRSDSSCDSSNSSDDSKDMQADMTVEKEGLFPLGTRVATGPDFESEWTENGESMLKFEKGVVISHKCSSEGHVLVQWDNGFKMPLRCGHDNAYDVMPDETNQAPACRIDDPIKVGLKVRRGPDWQFGNQDGGSDQLGTVYGILSNGEVLVRWPNGNIGNYRHSFSNTYDVLISDPVDPFGTDFYTTEMNRRNQLQ